MSRSPTALDPAGPRALGGSQQSHEKEAALLDLLAAWPAVIIAYSGGVDSAYLAWAATQVLGRQALCITADSPSYPERHRALALRIAADFALHHEIIRVPTRWRA